MKFSAFPRGVFALIVLLGALILKPDFARAITLDQFRDVVIAEKAPPPVREAAQDLRHHLAKIAGREFPLAEGKANAAAEGFHFYVGPGLWPEQDARAEKLGAEGYLLATVPSGVLLSGGEGNLHTGSGVRHAVSLFLEEHCGVRWLWPGESGEVVPANSKLEIPVLNQSGAPVLRRHFIKFYPSRFWDAKQREDSATYSRRTRQGDQMRAGFGHAHGSVIPAKDYFEAHPEWFSFVNGKRIPAQLCTSNLQMRDQFVKNLLALPLNQKLDIVSVSANDGYGFCECELCRAKAQGEGEGDYHNAAYWDFVADIATRVKVQRPGLGVGTLAYTYSRQPPKNISKLPDNVYLSMTSYATQMMLGEGEKEYRDFVESWKSKGVKIVIYEYWGMHYWLDLPVLYPREIAEEIKLAHSAGMIGAYGEGGKNFSTQAPNYYVLTRQLWNPQADPEKSLDEFYAAFGPSAASVREYFEAMGRAVKRTWRAKNLAATYVKTVTAYDEMFDSATLSKAKAALDAADAKANGDAALKERLAFIRSGYDYTVLMAELLGLYEKLGRTGFPLTFFEWQATAEAARRIFKNPDFSEKRDFFEARLKEPFSYTLEEKDQWLRRAWELGQKRIEMLNASRSSSALDEGIYGRALEISTPAWHETVGKYLGKPESEIIELIHTKTVKKMEPVKPVVAGG